MKKTDVKPNKKYPFTGILINFILINLVEEHFEKIGNKPTA